MTTDQVSDEYILDWIRERLSEDCEQYERNTSVLDDLDECGLDVTDVLFVLRHVVGIVGRYEGGCYIVTGPSIDNVMVSVVVAPPSAKNRVRVVKVWVD